MVVLNVDALLIVLFFEIRNNNEIKSSICFGQIEDVCRFPTIRWL